jgi:hypothetical protein
MNEVVKKEVMEENKNKQMEEGDKKNAMEESNRNKSSKGRDNTKVMDEDDKNKDKDVGNINKVLDEADKAKERNTNPDHLATDSSITSSPAALYCYCRSPISKDLVGCDFCTEWFHPSCLGLSQTELQLVLVLSNWKCPQCVQKTYNETIEEETNADQDKHEINPDVNKERSPSNRSQNKSNSGPQVVSRATTSSSPSSSSSTSSLMVSSLSTRAEKCELTELVARDWKCGDCHNCKVLVEEVKKRGEVIQNMAKKHRTMEEAPRSQ